MHAGLLSFFFYQRDTILVAEDLLGKILVRETSSETLRSRIVETEAYLGAEDQACHTFGGRRTERTEPMYGPPGSVYVYFIYGMYHCMNIVTGGGEAVLIRALEPLDGFSEEDRKTRALSGPGKLCRRQGIHKAHNRLNVWDPNSELRVEEGHPTSALASGPRIGISELCGDAKHYPLRFWLEGNKFHT